MTPRSLVMLLTVVTSPLVAAPVYWTDWASGTGTTAIGTITTSSSSVAVTYTNPQSYAFLQNGETGDLTDYFRNRDTGRDASISPYTSSVVDNIPTAAEMIGLRYAGTQTLTFSETIANPFFAYVSLNSNGYAFNRDFEILSFGANTAEGGFNDEGYWGPGTSSKQVVDIGGGVLEYRLIGTGEPHGTIRFIGAFDSVSWRSLSNEYWNGFTVGVEGTKQEVFGVPDAGSTLFLLSLVLLPTFAIRRHRS